MKRKPLPTYDDMPLVKGGQGRPDIYDTKDEDGTYDESFLMSLTPFDITFVACMVLMLVAVWIWGAK